MIQTLKNVKEYKEELIRPAIREMLEALDIARDLRPGMKVVIKPNLVMAKKPEAPVTTHPLVVKAVAEWLREQGIEDITLAESSGGPYTPEHMKRIYHVCGMDTLGDRNGEYQGRLCQSQLSSHHADREGRLYHQYLQTQNPCHDRIFRRYQKSLWNHSGS